jgi:hypothetical protein
MASMPSKPSKVVARRSTEVTVPEMLSIVTMSPTRILRSNRMMTPLIRFLMMFCVPKPTPMASAPPRKAKAVSGMCASSSTTTSTASSSNANTQRLSTRPSCGVSCSRCTATPISARLSRRAANQPTTNSSSTPTALPTVTPCSRVIVRPSTRLLSLTVNSS